MSPKNLNVPNKIHKILLSKLKKKKLLEIYKKFEINLDLNQDFIVAVSGGPDSLVLAFLAKIYSIKNNIDVNFFIVDHKLRKGSTREAKLVKKKLKEYSINLNILNWYGKKPKTNIQSIAREKRYKLLFENAKKLKVNNILLGHHQDDLLENFLIRILRGSGLNGLVSLDKRTQNQKINLLRPLLDYNKKDLIYICKYIYGSFVSDPSNQDDKFKRVRIRILLNQLEKEGFDKKKFSLTIKNLKYANETIKFYTKKNLETNVFFLKRKSLAILNKNFFYQSDEVAFRSFKEIIKLIGKKYYSPRGKKIDSIINLVNIKPTFKVTLGGCVIKKVNQTLIVTKE